MDESFGKAVQEAYWALHASGENLKAQAFRDVMDGVAAEVRGLIQERDAQQARADEWRTVAAEFQAQCEAEKKRAEAVMRDLQKLCEHGGDNCTDWACSLCKHSVGKPPLGSTDDCELLRFDDETDEIVGECKWEWRGSWPVVEADRSR